MDCPADSLLADFASGKLRGTQAAKFREHVANCSKCYAKVARPPGPPGTAPELPSTQHSAGWDSQRVARAVAESDLDSHFKRGASIGRYKIIERIGAGGMGVVYLALDPALDRRVALKLMRPDAFAGNDTAEGRARLMREAHAMAKLNHPNVVAIFDVGEFEQQIFLAMNLVDGMSVRDWLEKEPRSWREILKVFIEAGRGLEAAHAVGLIHRDFKPDNVLVDHQGHAHVTDFGLARAATAPPETDLDHETQSSDSSSDVLLSQPLTRGVSGTPGYMSPEQALGKPVDARTDQYSFCVSLSEALYGSQDGKLEWAPFRDPAMAAAVPRWVRAAVAKGMSEEAADRFPTMSALLVALGKDPAAARRRWAIAGVGLALVAVIAGLVAYTLKKRESDICFAPERHFNGLWDENAKRNLRAAFVATGAPKAAETAERTIKAFDRARDAWLGGYRQACDATREKKEQPEAALSLRVACLDTQLYDFRGALELLGKPDESLVGSAVTVAASLPSVAECNNAFSLSLVEPPPTRLAPEIQSLRVRMARGRALNAAQRWAEARDILVSLSKEAVDAGYPPVAAEAFFALAGNQQNLSANKDAAENYQLALDSAEASRMDDLATRAAAKLIWQVAQTGAGDRELKDTIKRAQILLQRVGKGGLPERDFEQALEGVAGVRGITKDEVLHGKNALELSEHLFGPDDPNLLSLLNNYALDLIDDGQYDSALECYRRAIALSDHLFGPDAPSCARQWAYYGLILANQGRGDEALVAAEHTLQARGDSPPDADIALARAIKAYAFAAQRKPEAANDEIRIALNIGTHLNISTTLDFDNHNLLIGEAALLLKDPKRAVEAFERNLIADKELDSASPAWVGNLQLGGAAYLAAGDPMKARVILEKGLSLSSGHLFYPRWVPGMRLHLAQALIALGEDRQRAEELVHQAREELSKQPGQEALLGQLDDWERSTFTRR